MRLRTCFLVVGTVASVFLTGCGTNVANFTGQQVEDEGGNDPANEVPDDGPVATGDPIEAPMEEWTWVEFDDAHCANGETTGIGVNLTDRSDDLIIYLMGGGACWSFATCYIANIAANVSSGYGESQFDGDANGMLSSTTLFNRNSPDNPFRDASYVFVPYCTGDVHAGDNVVDYQDRETWHVGRANIVAFLDRIVPTFPNAKRVALSGSSAGGFGAGMNWGRVQELFGDTPVFLLDDSGPTLPNPYLKESLESEWSAAWGLADGFPADCKDCASDFDALFTYYAGKYPDQRGALLSYTLDPVISFFFQVSQQQVKEGLTVLAETRLEPHPQLQYFFVEGDQHVLLGDPDAISQNGVALLDWIDQMWSGDPAWTSVAP